MLSTESSKISPPADAEGIHAAVIKDENSDLSVEIENAKGEENSESKDDDVQKELHKPLFRMLVQRKSVFRKLEMEETEEIIDVKSVLKCGYCSVMFSDESCLINHLVTHDNRSLQPIRQNKQSDQTENMKYVKYVKGMSENKNVQTSTSEQSFMQCGDGLSPAKENKPYSKLNSKTDLTNIEISVSQPTNNEQSTGKNVLHSHCVVTVIPDNKKTAERRKMSSISPINKSNLSDKDEKDTPRQAMASVGKRKTKKILHDDFIMYDLNKRKTENKEKNSYSTKTRHEIEDKQKTLKNKSRVKKCTKKNSGLYSNPNFSEGSVNRKTVSLEKMKDKNVTSLHETVVQEENKTVSKSTFIQDCDIHHHLSGHHKHSVLESITDAKYVTSKSINITSNGSPNPKKSKQVKVRTGGAATYLRCVTCKGCYLWQWPFLEHLKIHPNEKPFECLTCQKRFLSFFSYMTHIRNFHCPRKTNCCRKCGKGFSSWYLLRLHLIRPKSCTGTRFPCSLCEKYFPYGYMLSRHLTSVHLKTKNKSSVSLSCKPCGKLFRDRRNLWIHQKRHPNAVKPYKCHFCSKKFAMHKWLIEHVQRHIPERNYPCGLCGKCYFTKSDATMHERRHTKEATFICTECDKRFIYRSELNAHIKRHQGIRLPKNIICDICSKAFSTRRDVERHLTVHTGEKPYKCHICSKCFSQEVNMQVHVKVHSGERPYQCDLCDKRFIAKSKLTRHRRCHTTSKGLLPRPFKCVLCPRKYTAENSLIRHLRTHRDSAEIIDNIQSALNKALKESNTAESTACAGSVLACMIDQAILDARRLARNQKNYTASGDLSLAEIIDQAIHDSKTASCTQTPAMIDSFNNPNLIHKLPSSNISKNVAPPERYQEQETGSNDITTNSCSDLIKLISDALSKHNGTDQDLYTKKTFFEHPLTQTVVVKPKSSVLKSGHFVQITKHDSHNSLLADQKAVISDSQGSMLEMIKMPQDISSGHQDMKVALDSGDSQHVYVQNFTPDDPSYQNQIFVVPVSELDSDGPEQQLILLDTLNEQSYVFQSSPTGLENTCHQNIMSVDEKSTLVMIPSSINKLLNTAPLSSSINQIVMPNYATDLIKKEHNVLVPSDTSTSHSTSLKSASSSKVHHVIVRTSEGHMLMIPSLDESSHIPVTVTSPANVVESLDHVQN